MPTHRRRREREKKKEKKRERKETNGSVKWELVIHPYTYKKKNKNAALYATNRTKK